MTAARPISNRRGPRGAQRPPTRCVSGDDSHRPFMVSLSNHVVHENQWGQILRKTPAVGADTDQKPLADPAPNHGNRHPKKKCPKEATPRNQPTVLNSQLTPASSSVAKSVVWPPSLSVKHGNLVDVARAGRDPDRSPTNRTTWNGPLPFACPVRPRVRSTPSLSVPLI